MSNERDDALTFESDLECEVWLQERRDYLAETGRLGTIGPANRNAAEAWADDLVLALRKRRKADAVQSKAAPSEILRERANEAEKRLEALLAALDGRAHGDECYSGEIDGCDCWVRTALDAAKFPKP